MTSDVLAAFDRFKAQVDRAYEAAREQLARHDVTGAQAILTRVAEVHGRAAELVGRCVPPCITCGKDDHDGTEDHPMARTDTLAD